MRRLAVTAFIALLIAAPSRKSEAQNVGAQAQIAGMWRGNSECVLKNGACHDEINVYRFSEITARPGWFSGAGSKVVNGEEISMGTLEWQYDATSHILKSESPHGTFRFVVDNEKMDGTLFLPDTTIYRRIHLAKAK